LRDEVEERGDETIQHVEALKTARHGMPHVAFLLVKTGGERICDG